MIITEKFVVINFPKTGSTFVRKVFDLIHERRRKNLLSRLNLFVNSNGHYERIKVPNIRTHNARYLKDDEHGTVSQIPEQFRDREIVSVKRNVFDYLISLYEFGDWRKDQALWIDKAEIHRFYPNFPDLSFDEFIKFMYSASPHLHHPFISNVKDLGFLSALYIMFYAKRPFEIFEKIRMKGIQSVKSDDFAKIIFLSQENLRLDLFNFLSAKGYPKRQIEFIQDYPEQNTSIKKKSNYYNSELITFIEERETFLYKIFNAYEV